MDRSPPSSPESTALAPAVEPDAARAAPPSEPAAGVERVAALSLFPEVEPEEPPFHLSAEHVLESMSDAFAFLDRALRYRHTNRRADELHLRHGRARGEVLGRTVAEAFPALAGGAFERALRSALETGLPAECETEMPGGCVYELRLFPSPEGVAVYVRDVSARARAEAEQAVLARAGDALARSLDPETLLGAWARTALPLLGRWCFVHVPDAEGPGLVVLEHVAPEKAEILEGVARLCREGGHGAADPFTQVMESGEPRLVPEVGGGFQTAAAGSEAYRALARAAAPATFLCVPLVARGRTLGAASFASDDPARRFGERDLALAKELAARAALALDNARLYREATAALARAGESRAVLDALFRAAPVGLAFLDAELRYRTVNDALAAVNGVAPSAHLGRAIGEVVPGCAEVLAPLLGRVLETGEPVRDFEWSGEVPGFPGEARHWLESFYPVRGDDGAVRGVGVALSEVTAHKRAEEAQRFLSDASRLVAPLADREAWLAQLPRSALPRLGDFCVVDLAGEGGRVERTLIAHVDPAKEAAAREFRRRFPLHERKAVFPILRVLATGRPAVELSPAPAYVEEMVDGEEGRALLRVLAPDSYLLFPLEARGRMLGTMSFVMSGSGRRHTEGDVALAEELVRRVSLAVDNVRLYEAERAARAEAEAANRAKSEFLATMSHELRTPLNAIGGYAQLVDMGIHGPVTEAQRESLRRIERNQRHLLGLINDVLSFARIESGHVSLRLEDVDLAAAVAGVEPLVGPQLGARSLAYAARVDGGRPLLARADAERVRQILLNLLSNAVKFTPPGGSVRVEADAVEGGVEVRVRDTGIGIPPERLEEVFEPFVQLDRGLTRSAEGTGLGLAISRDLARAMGGDLRAAPNPGGGSVFTLTLPPAGS